MSHNHFKADNVQVSERYYSCVIVSISESLFTGSSSAHFLLVMDEDMVVFAPPLPPPGFAFKEAEGATYFLGWAFPLPVDGGAAAAAAGAAEPTAEDELAGCSGKSSSRFVGWSNMDLCN